MMDLLGTTDASFGVPKSYILGRCWLSLLGNKVMDNPNRFLSSNTMLQICFPPRIQWQHKSIYLPMKSKTY
jgi:hypothetical protein